MLGLGEEVGQYAAVDLGLTELAALEQALAGGIERAVQQSEESKGLGSQDLAMRLVNLAEDGYALEDGVCVGHCGDVYMMREGGEE